MLQPTDIQPRARVLSSDQQVAIFDAMPNGLIVLNHQGRVIQANAQAQQLLSVSLLNQLWRDVIGHVFAPQANDGHEVSLKNGLLVKVSTSPLSNQLGQLIVITDLTETRLLQARVGHLQRLSSLGKMIATLAHQIRTPLSAAMLYAANLSVSSLPDNARAKFSCKVLERLKELESQVNDMLLFAKSGEQNVVTSLPITELLASVASSVSGIEGKYANRLHIGSIPSFGQHQPIHILGNKTALSGALQNLIHNAFQVSAKQQPVELAVHIESDHVCHFTVRDHGPGIDEQQQQHLFTPFYTTKAHGTGLGLAVVQSVAKSHQGSVSVQNHATGGAMFTLSIPIHSANTCEET